MNTKALVAGSVILGVIILAGGGLAAWKYRAMNAPPPPAQIPPEAVDIVDAKTVLWQQKARLSGTVFAIQSITLSNEVAGSIKEVKFNSGDVVEAGQPLILFDTTSQQADLAAAEANVRVTQSAVRVVDSAIKLWEANERRLTQAVESKAASLTDLDTARANLEQGRANLVRANAEIDQAKAKVEQVKTTIAKMTLRAPFKARAGIRSVHPGQYMAEGTTAVALQSITDDIYLDFALPQDQASRAHPGDVFMCSGPLLGAAPVPIEVMALDATADRETRNVRIRSRVANPGERLRPGMSVDIEVPVSPPLEFVAIPSVAIRRASFGDHIFLVTPKADAPGMFEAHQKFIKLGPSVGEDVIVEQGIKVGDRLASVGSFKLREGALVMQAPPTPPATPGKNAESAPGEPTTSTNPTKAAAAK